MEQLSQQAIRAKGYKVFEQLLRGKLAALAGPSHTTSTRIKQTALPTFANPVETFELEAGFPGATLLATFGQSIVDSTLFFSELELRHPSKPTLFVRDYLASRQDPKLNALRFHTTEIDLEQGIATIVEAWGGLLDQELRTVLEGRAWVTAPFDWGEEK